MEPLPDRLPLVIGVTGHRDLREQDLPELERQVAAVMADLQHDYLGHLGETPIIVLSSLAEGADRLVARVALAQGARLVAPLPMPLDEYRRDFEPGLKPGNMAEFDQLLAQAVAAPVMPFEPGNSLEAVRADGGKRGEQYRAVGLFIAQHCNVLVALWDGDDTNVSAGGTAEVAGFKRDGIPLAVSGSVRASLDASEVGPVVHVVTPREKDTNAADAVSVAPWGRAAVRRYRGGIVRRFVRGVAEFVASVFGQELRDARAGLSAKQQRELESWETFEALTTLSRNFNREAAALTGSSEGQAQVSNSLRDLFAAAAEKPSVEPAVAQQHAVERAGRWCRLYAVADALARKRQRQFRRDWLHVYALGFVAFLCFALFSLFELASNFILVAYSLAFVGIFLVFARAYFGNHQVQFLDYRAFAEALRVAIFSKLVGIGLRHADAKAAAGPPALEVSTFGAVAAAYPIKQPSELAWVKICLHVLELVEAAEPPTIDHNLDPISEAVTREFWVKGQLAFFRRGAARHTRFADKLENSALVLLAVSPFLLVPFVIAFTPPPANGHEGLLRQVLLLVSGLLPGLGTALNGYSDKLALKAQARQYDRMRVLFERALELFPRTIDEQTAPLARSLYAELGAEALKEQAEWVAIYRQRPIEPPK